MKIACYSQKKYLSPLISVVERSKCLKMKTSENGLLFTKNLEGMSNQQKMHFYRHFPHFPKFFFQSRKIFYVPTTENVFFDMVSPRILKFFFTYVLGCFFLNLCICMYVCMYVLVLSFRAPIIPLFRA